MTLTQMEPQKISLGGGTLPRLPDAYQEVEYIQSTGTQYINTGWTPASNYCKVIANVTPTTAGYIFGMHTASDDRFALWIDYGDWRVDLGDSYGIWTDLPSSFGTNVDVELTGDNYDTELKVGGVTSTVFSGYSGTLVQSTRPMYIFANNDNGTISSAVSTKLYSFKIYSGEDILARDFVPCYRKSDNEIGLYDLVNGAFYSNVGTGTFSKGNDTTAKMIKKIMMWPNNVETQIWPANTFEFSYDFRGGSLAGFQAAGGKDIYTNGAYSFYNDGLGQTSNSNDRYITPLVELPDITNAKILTVKMSGYFIANSRSNNKGCGFGDGTSEWAYSTLRRTGEMSYNTSSASYYDRAGLCIVDGGTQTWKYLAGQFAFNTGDIELTVTINLDTGVCTYNTTGANTISGTYTMTSAEISQFKSNVRYGCASRGRGYSTYNNERLHTLYIKVEY